MAGSANTGASFLASAASSSPSTTQLSPDTGGAFVASTASLPRDESDTRLTDPEGKYGIPPNSLNARGPLSSSGEPGVPTCVSVNHPPKQGSTSSFSMSAFGRHDPLSSTPLHMQSGLLSSSSGGFQPPNHRTDDSDSAACRSKPVDRSSCFDIPGVQKGWKENAHVESHGNRIASAAVTPSPYHVVLPESSSSCRVGRVGSFDSRSTTASPDFPPPSGTQSPHQGRPREGKPYAASECASVSSANHPFVVPVASVSRRTDSSIEDLRDRFSSCRHLCASVGSTVATVRSDPTRPIIHPTHKTSCLPSSSHGVLHSPNVDALSLPTPSLCTNSLSILPYGTSTLEEGADQVVRGQGMEEDDDDFLGDSFVVVEAVEGREEVHGCSLSPPPLRFPSHCFSADGLWDSEGPHGDFAVSVSDPETRSTGPLGRFTLYLVSGRTVVGAPFACRKRYSDFEWLRMQLVQAFPGVFVPPIPRKQKLGRFDSSFVESRRQGLQEFLQRLFRRRHLARCSVFVGWLTRSPEGGMDQLKKEVAARPLVEQLGEFQEIFRAQLDGANGRGTRAESDRFIVFKQFLGKQLTTLEELHRNFSRLASLSRSQFGCVSALQNLLKDVCSSEENLVRQMPDLPIPAVRCELASLVSLQRACLVASPAHNYDVMQQVVAKEFDDTECMLEAVAGLERLVQLKHQAQAQIAREENSLRHVLRSARGSWLQTFVHRKDKDAQIAEIRASIEALKLQVQVLEQWAEASRAVWVTVEMPKLVTAKSIAFTRAAHAFIDRQQQQFLQEARIWQAYGLRTGASSNELSSQLESQPRHPGGPDTARKH